MNTSARCVFAQCIFLYAALAHSAADPVADCRARYAEHPPEHIACLERALGGAPKEVAPPSLGTEQLRAKPSQDTVEQVAVKIENVTYGFDGRAVFRTNDGQVWKGTESTPREQRLDPGKTYAGRIERGTLGGYKMYLDGVRRMIRVTRTQ